MTAISRAAKSSMRLTAVASQVGLSHSTQACRPSSMASESKGSLAGFMGCSSLSLEYSFSGEFKTVTRTFYDGLVKRASAPAFSGSIGCERLVQRGCGRSRDEVGLKSIRHMTVIDTA